MRFACLWIACLGSLSGPETPPAPVSWSPDGRWLAYSQEVGPIHQPGPGWLFGEDEEDAAKLADVPRKYRLWTTRPAMPPETGESVLLLESDSRVSPPSWKRDGTALVYGRVVRGSDGGRSQWEIVVQDAPDHRQVVWKEPFPGAEPSEATVRNLAPLFSPDGRLLVLPRTSPTSLRIVRAEGGRLLKTLDGASRPQWSHEGGKLAFFREGLDGGLFVLDTVLGQQKKLASFASGDAEGLPPPVWSHDGSQIQYLRLALARSDESSKLLLQIVKVYASTGIVESTSDLSLEMIPHRKQWLGASLTVDPLGKELYYASAFIGQSTSQFAWCEDANRPLEIKSKLNPYDQTALLGALAARPDAQGLALRFGNFGSWSPPAVFDPVRGDLLLLAPDDASRIDWQGRIALTIREILRDPELIPQPTLGEEKLAVERPSLLPAPGEMEEDDQVSHRLRHLARRALELGPVAAPETRATLAYLAKDYRLTLSAVDEMRESSTDPAHSARLLALRAQILLAQGDFSGAKFLLAYLRSQYRASFTIEETNQGRKLTAIEDPRVRWADFLGVKIDLLKALRSAPVPVVEEPGWMDRLPGGLNPFQNNQAPPPGF